MNTPQLMTIMKYAVWPIIQIEGVMDRLGQTTRKRKDLPDELAARVNLTLLPNPDAHSLEREHKQSPTKLLAATLSITSCERTSEGVYPNFSHQPF